MKTLFLFSAILLFCSSVFSQNNVGIGTLAPLARLHVSDSSVLFSATGPALVNPGNTPVSNGGRRLMWYADKAAFRVGHVVGSQWNKNNIGNYSFASGQNTIASGVLSTALGYATIASGDYSTALGSGSIASGGISTALGSGSIASGGSSTAIGTFTIASGYNSAAMGAYTTAKSGYETVLGTFNTEYDPVDIQGLNAADRLFVIGNGTSSISRSDAMVILKNSNVGIGTSTPALLFQVAKNTSYITGNSYGIAVTNATNTNLRLNLGYDAAINAAVIQASEEGESFNKNLLLNPNAGKVGIGVTSPLARLHVADSSVLFSALGDVPLEIYKGNPPLSGEGRRMIWYADKAAFRAGYVFDDKWDKVNIGDYSIALGYNVQASGTYSVSLGAGNTSSGQASVVMGGNSDASGGSSVAIGEDVSATNYNSLALGLSTISSGQRSTAMGGSTTASGTSSTSMGEGTNATGEVSTAMGNQTNASGFVSTAIGGNTTASGDFSTAMGESTFATNYFATAMGNSTNASGHSSTAMGVGSTASGGASTAMGNGSISVGYSST